MAYTTIITTTVETTRTMQSRVAVTITKSSRWCVALAASPLVVPMVEMAVLILSGVNGVFSVLHMKEDAFHL